MPSRRRSRENALQMIYQWDVGGEEPAKVVEDFYGRLSEDSPRPVDRFAEQLFLRVAGEAEELDAIIQRHSNNWSLDRMAQVVRHLLRLAISEIRSGRTPPGVVIDEALEIGRRFAGEGSTKFLNGVLEAARREVAQKAGRKEPDDG